MIYGVGTDLVALERMALAHARHGQRLVERLLHPDEQAELARRSAHAQSAQAERLRVAFLAKRFAAKEALGKALGTGLSHPMGLQQVSILTGPQGQPMPQAHGPLAEHLSGLGITLHLSLADERDHALAFAIAEQHPQPISTERSA